MEESNLDQLLEEGENLQSEMNEEILLNCIKSSKEKIKINSNLRIKFSGDPEKYLESEIDLHEEIKVLQRIAAYPNLIQIFVDLEGVDLLIHLLNHENVDIINDSIVVIEEITDADYLQDVDHPKEFLELFISKGLFDLLVSNLYMTNELQNEDDQQIVSDLLSVIENFLDVYPYSAKLFGERTKLINWLLMRIKSGDLNEKNFANKLFASELLNSIIQYSTENQIILARKEGMPHLLKILLENSDRKISSGDEEEFIHNIVNTICGLMLTKENQTIFRNSDGIRINLNFLKENNLFRHLSIKILDFATQNNFKNCVELVDKDGLGPIFSYFMGKGLKNKGRFESLIEIAEEHCISILCSLIKYLKGIHLERFLYKFKENNLEKCERLLEFYKKFEKRVKTFESKKPEENSEEEEEEIKDKLFIDKINIGYFNIQSLCLILGFLLTSHHQDIIDKLNKLFNIYNLTKDDVIFTLEDMSSHLGEDSFTSNEDSDKISIKSFVDNIINKLKFSI